MKESPVFVKLFDFVAWVIPLTVKFPREQRFVVAAQLQREVFAAHEALIRAGQSTAPDTTLAHLGDVATHLALVRFYLRLSERLVFITTRQYEYAAERLDELGRLVQAWRRTCHTKLATMDGTTGSLATGTTRPVSIPLSITAMEAEPGTPAP